jgi:hypothetical protein
MARRFHYHIIGEIRDDIKRIEKLVLDADDGFAEPAWCGLKADIKALADQCDGLRAERKKAEREERREQRAAEKEARCGT